MTNKRKGSSVLVSMTPASSTLPTRNWETLQEDLKALKVKRSHNRIGDLLMAPLFCTKHQELRAPICDTTKRLANQSKELHETFQTVIDKEQKVLSMETDIVYRLEKEVSELSTRATDLRHDLDDLQPLTLRAKDSIYESKQYLEQEHEEVELVQHKHMQQVPRLKEQISLYARTTGIKWDYDSDPFLEGTMAVPEQKRFVKFNIDPTEHTLFAVANYLWDKMEGRT
uniref:Kinetochore protein Spc24 n=1 Tax=Grammatophora oceanica TaxID=210454 RepID=A0A7S1Y058_9STRA|mmetsp:Transcript_13795/g.20199  ORF Transcript_13795/g.20199 Transcript_13795/m.20199 type:complete len:227 (+) Transcript_13795:24-704(+)